MNFLGHLYLSGDNDQIKIGNFIGDFVKGNPTAKYNGGILQGIILHREIDHFTDTHPTSLISKRRLVDKYRHYSGVITDIYYDHFLAANWDQFSDKPLDQFAQECYQLMDDNASEIPEKARHMLKYMSSGNWLGGYAHLDGIQRTLSGMSRRTSFKSQMEEAVTELKDNYSLFENDFFTFFADIEIHVTQYIEHYGKSN